MKKTLFLGIILFFFVFAKSQPYYFPPLEEGIWESLDPNSLGWATDSIPPLLDFLEKKNSKAFIILKRGKIVVEHYFGDFTQDDPWYWASAGKSLAAYLVGIAQDEGFLHIDSATSQYLGENWSSLSFDQENKIKVKHQLSMTTGLNDQMVDLNCLSPECLTYLVPPGTRWSYHNAPYRLIQDVVAAASGISFQQFTNTRLRQTIGLRGLWINYVFWSKPRAMARFGLLALNKGVWEQETILRDSLYINAMRTSSQPLNPSYGYLWWLNGQGQYMLPSLQFLFNENIIPTAPLDMYAALGKNDQKIYIVPSMDLVVIRMGEDAGDNNFAASSFDTQLWERLTNLMDTSTDIQFGKGENYHTIFPNPAKNIIHFSSKSSPYRPPLKIELIHTNGKVVYASSFQKTINLPSLSTGVYLMRLIYADDTFENHKIAIR